MDELYANMRTVDYAEFSYLAQRLLTSVMLHKLQILLMKTCKPKTYPER